MRTLDEALKVAHPARLIPTVADSRKEERLVSILLATLPRVRPFAEQFLDRCGERLGKSSVLASYTEVEFPSADGGSKDRPDGLLCLTTRKARWTALLEAKIEKAEIDEEQIQKYADLAKRFQINAIITLSNQLVPLPTHVPYSVPKKISNQVDLFHMSWISILTIARLILRRKDEIDPSQAFVLEEMARYFEHSSSGVKQFDQMNSEWRPLVLGIRDGQQFKWNSPEIENTVTSWHQEERDLCLILSRRIGEQVSIRGMSRKYRAKPARRLRDACDALTSTNELHSSFSVPNAASDLDVTADLNRRTISCSMKINAPLDRQRASARINWLRRQLRDVHGDDVRVRAFWPGKAIATQAPLSEVKLDSKCLENTSRGMAPTGFEVVMIRDIAGRFSGRRTFIEDLENMIPEFYDEVGQHLRPWTPPPPSIDKKDPIKEDDADYSDQEAIVESSSPAEIDDSDRPQGLGNVDWSPAGEE